jgi:CxxC motif-containing protein (DUF1111 family)
MTRVITAMMAVGILGCGGRTPSLSRDLAGTPLTGGAATVFDDSRDAFSLPVPILSQAHRTAFFVGNSFFNQNWISAPASVTSRDGLGPLYNARSCSGCHFKDGRSRPPDPGSPMTTMLLRISVPGRGAQGAPVGDPVYGDQIQGNALPRVAREADVRVDYDVVSGRFADGEPYSLRRPRIRVDHLGYGPLSQGLLMSARVAPAMIGLGLLEAVPESLLRAMADPEDRDQDGISGRLNEVWDIVRKTVTPGRFGWKAEQPSVVQQCAGAFVGDMGLTSSLFASENHTDRQVSCRGLPSGGSPEVGDDVLASVALYARSLAVPARRHYTDDVATRGEKVFARARCVSCHVPTLRTEPRGDLPGDLAELGGIEIHPYTDLLLHDLGDGLSDQRPTFAADGREWRTAPLWGVGLVRKVNDHSFLLHDGRARDFAEAILWHDGEANAARTAFVAMNRDDRLALLSFLDSL